MAFLSQLNFNHFSNIFSDRICTTVTTCNLQTQVEYYPPTNVSNRVCVNSKICGEFINSQDSSCTVTTGQVTIGVNQNYLDMPVVSIGGQLGVNNVNFYSLNLPILTSIGGAFTFSNVMLTVMNFPSLRSTGWYFVVYSNSRLTQVYCVAMMFRTHTRLIPFSRYCRLA